MTIICGHTLTKAEVLVLDTILGYLRQHSGDSFWTSNTRPKGDGRNVPISELFGQRNNTDNARRRTVSRLDKLGILRACDIEYRDGQLKGVPTR